MPVALDTPVPPTLHTAALTKRKPAWVEALWFVGTMAIVWAALHIGMNWGAYRQVFTHRGEKLLTWVQTTVLQPGPILGTSSDASLPAPLAVGGVKGFHPLRVLTANPSKQILSQMEVMPPDNRLYIPSIEKNVPLITVPNGTDWDKLEEDIQEGLKDGVVPHPISHPPDQMGNFFITGHSSYYAWDDGRYKDVFALLHDIHPGETVYLYWQGKKYTYALEEERVIDPSDVEVLRQPDDQQMITLMTCTPIGTNKKRLILRGHLVEST